MKRRLRLLLPAWRRLALKVEYRQGKAHLVNGSAYCLSGAVHSGLFRLQHGSHAEALKGAVVPPPFFVLGYWRSGTTFLHELLCCDRRVGFPTTYACMNPSHFLLTEAWGSKSGAKQQSTRPMDNMSYSWSSPQEDEFALFAMGAPSPYEALLFPSLLRDPGGLVDMNQLSLDEQERWANLLKEFLLLLTVQQRKAMVLKSPPHGFRLALLLQKFPGAHFVVIERNPYEVFASNLKLWRTLLDMYALEEYSVKEIEDFVLQSYLLHEDVIAKNLAPELATRVRLVRYEALVRDPIGEMERLYKEWKVDGFSEVKLHMQDYTRNHSGYIRNRFTLSKAQKKTIEESWGQIITQKGYDWPAEHLTLS